MAEAVTGPLGPFIALFAGLLSVLSPCVLPLIPIYIAHLSGNSFATSTGAGTAPVSVLHSPTFAHALAFVAGFTVVFVVLGASVGLVGYVLRDQMDWLTRVAGIVLIVFGLQIAGILKIPWLERSYTLNVKRQGRHSPMNSALVGAAFSIGWTPCIGPILGSILTLAATSGTVWQGASLLIFYSIGLSLPFLLVGAAMQSATHTLKRLQPLLPTVAKAGGLMIAAMGIIIFLGRFTVLYPYFDFFGLGSGI